MYLQDYSTSALPIASASCHSSGSPYDLLAHLTYSHLYPQYKSYLITVNQSQSIPQYFSQAIQDPMWREAMDKEILALETTKTWVLTPLPPSKRPIGCNGCIG